MTAEESEIYFYAFRYYLGRMTYAVSDFCRQATKKIAEIKTHDLELMDKEITEAEQWDKENPDSHGRLGMECDRAEWLKFRGNHQTRIGEKKMSELKNCPFCNGTHSINVINFFTGNSFRKCDICGAEAPEAKTPEEAVEKWNTRPAEDALKAKNEELCSTISSMEKTIGRAEKVLGERNLLAAEVERLRAALKKIYILTFMPRNKDKVLDMTWHITKAALREAAKIHERAYFGTDINVPANAPDTGKMEE